MLVTTGLVALSAKVRDDKARRKALREASKEIPTACDSKMKGTLLAIESGSPLAHGDEAKNVYALAS
jgi:hypothetical protein